MNQLGLDIRQEKTRLSKQCEAILGRLQQGPVSNHLLAGTYALKYTSRISDLRRRDHDVRVIERDHRTGRTLYALFVDGKQMP